MSSRDLATVEPARAPPASCSWIVAASVVLPLPMDPNRTRCSPFASRCARSAAMSRRPNGIDRYRLRFGARRTAVTGQPSPHSWPSRTPSRVGSYCADCGLWRCGCSARTGQLYRSPSSWPSTPRWADGAAEAAGIAPGLIRLAVGLEHPDDLLADLHRTLALV